MRSKNKRQRTQLSRQRAHQKGAKGDYNFLYQSEYPEVKALPRSAIDEKPRFRKGAFSNNPRHIYLQTVRMLTVVGKVSSSSLLEGLYSLYIKYLWLTSRRL